MISPFEPIPGVRHNFSSPPWRSANELILEGYTPFENPVLENNELESEAETPFYDEMPYTSLVQGETEKNWKTRTPWAKMALNRLLGTTLQINDVRDTAFYQALNSFQEKVQLPKTNVLDATTERKLLEEDAYILPKSRVDSTRARAIISEAKTRIEDWTKRAVVEKKEITNNYRNPLSLFAFVLHQMAFKRRNKGTGQFSHPENYLKVGAHFCIMLDGKIIQLHAMSRMIWHAQGLSPLSVSVEFEGNFPDIRGKVWRPKDNNPNDPTFAKVIPTRQQIDAGRFLASYVQVVLGTSKIFAHRQSSINRTNDPGPDIWGHVGEWAIANLGFDTNARDARVGDGKPIPPEWRTWSDQHSIESEAIEEIDEEVPGPDFVEDYLDNIASEFPSIDIAHAVSRNRHYQQKLGWGQYYDQINDMLLPYAGLENVSLGEEAFAQAAAAWQQQNGFYGKDVDGIIGPNTWTKMKLLLTSGSINSQPQQIDVQSTNVVKPHLSGYKAYGGGALKPRLILLRSKGVLQATDFEIEICEMVAKSESSGCVSAINSWDNCYMTMGFVQLTFIHNKIQELIRKVPDSFSKYNIELDDQRPLYQVPNTSYKIQWIKNVYALSELRTEIWARRFYAAGLEDPVIVAQVGHIQDKIRTIIGYTNGYLNRFKDNLSCLPLWGFIAESHNSRPAILKSAIKETASLNSNMYNPIEFGRKLVPGLINHTRKYYAAKGQKRVDNEVAKVGRILKNTKADIYLGM